MDIRAGEMLGKGCWVVVVERVKMLRDQIRQPGIEIDAGVGILDQVDEALAMQKRHALRHEPAQPIGGADALAQKLVELRQCSVTLKPDIRETLGRLVQQRLHFPFAVIDQQQARVVGHDFVKARGDEAGREHGPIHAVLRIGDGQGEFVEGNRRCQPANRRACACLAGIDGTVERAEGGDSARGDLGQPEPRARVIDVDLADIAVDQAMRSTEGQGEILFALSYRRCKGDPRFGIAQKRRKPGRLGSRQFLRSCDHLGAEAHVQRKLRRRDFLLAQRAQIDRQGTALDARLVEIQRELEDLWRRSRGAQRLEPGVKAQLVLGQDEIGVACHRFGVAIGLLHRMLEAHPHPDRGLRRFAEHRA